MSHPSVAPRGAARALIGQVAALALLLACGSAFAAQQPVVLGAAPNDGTGDPLRSAFTKLNHNDAELYASVATLTAAIAGRQPLSAILTSLASGATPFGISLVGSSNEAAALALVGGVPTSRQVSAGAGLAGGGNLSTDRSISLAPVAAGFLLANAGGAAAAPTGTTLSALLDSAVGTGRGALIVRGAGGWAPLSLGTSGYALQSNGTDLVYAPVSPGTGSVRYDAAQALTGPQQSQAQSNIGVGSLGTQNAAAVAITGGAINGTPVGSADADTGAFTMLSAGASTLTSTSASALTVGRQGATNPVLQVDASTASVANGLRVKGAAAGAGVALSAISSAANDNLAIDAVGTGTITLGGTSSGRITLSRAFTASSSVTLSGIPTSDPSTSGALWNSGGQVLVSGSSGGWTAFTPTVGPGSGSLVGASVSASGRYRQVQRTVCFSLAVTIASLGSGSPGGSVQASLPVASPIALSVFSALNSGTGGSASSWAYSGQSILNLLRSDGTSPWAPNSYYASGCYEV